MTHLNKNIVLGFAIAWESLTTGETGRGDCLNLPLSHIERVVRALDQEHKGVIVHWLLPCCKETQEEKTCGEEETANEN